jgi:transcriptional regulator with XRE-family HTH domain
MILLRRELGDVLREQRQSQGKTLREVSAAASVSLGYLSEIERGAKEASSELLFSVCSALGLPLSDVLGQVSERVAATEAVAATESLTAPLSLPIPVNQVVSASAA